MDTAGKLAAAGGLGAVIAIASFRHIYPEAVELRPGGVFEAPAVALCVAAVFKGARPLKDRMKLLGGDKARTKNDPTYRTLMSEHRQWNSLSLTALIGVAAMHFGINPLMAMPIGIAAFAGGIRLADLFLGWST